MPLIKSGSNRAFKKNVETEMKANPGKANRAQNLAIAYATKRKAAHMYQGGEMGGQDESCPDCYAIGGTCEYHSGTMQKTEGGDDQSSETFAEGGMVNAKRPLQTKPIESTGDSEIEEFHPERDAAPMDMVDYGESQETASDAEKDLPRASKALSLAAEVMKDRARRSGGKPEDEGSVSTMATEKRAPNNVQSKVGLYAEGGQVSIPGQEEDDIDELTRSQWHDAQYMSKGGMAYKSNAGDDETSLAGNLHGTIDPANGMDETNDTDELDGPTEDGRWQRGLNLEPVHEMEDDEHDESSASLAQSVMRDRKKSRRR